MGRMVVGEARRGTRTTYDTRANGRVASATQPIADQPRDRLGRRDPSERSDGDRRIFPHRDAVARYRDRREYRDGYFANRSPNISSLTPRTVLLIDGIGGVATAIMLCLVLPAFHTAIGLPPRLLVSLGLCGVVYAAYSLGCWLFVKTRWRLALTIIIAANLLYCAVSALVVVTHWHTMTALGAVYFIGEIVVILTLVSVERVVRARYT